MSPLHRRFLGAARAYKAARAKSDCTECPGNFANLVHCRVRLETLIEEHFVELADLIIQLELEKADDHRSEP